MIFQYSVVITARQRFLFLRPGKSQEKMAEIREKSEKSMRGKKMGILIRGIKLLFEVQKHFTIDGCIIWENDWFRGQRKCISPFPKP